MYESADETDAPMGRSVESHFLQVESAWFQHFFHVESVRFQHFFRIESQPGESGTDAETLELQRGLYCLIDSGVVLPTLCCANPVFPLAESVKRNLLKLYLCDAGILTWLLYRTNAKPLMEDLPQVNLRNVYECFAAMQLASDGHRLFYSDDRRLERASFLLDDCGNMRVIALEIKSGKDFRKHKALDDLIGSSNGAIEGIVLSGSGTVEVEGGTRYLPIYAVMFMDAENRLSMKG